MSEDKENEFPRKGVSGNGTDTCYTVEARCVYSRPERAPNGQVFDQRWQEIVFNEGQGVGVPNHLWFSEAQKMGRYNWPAANALRWWFHASFGPPANSICFETRIVERKFRWSYEETVEKAHHVISGKDRSSMMPEWGKKEDSND